MTSYRPTEEWRAVVGMEGEYEVSSFGRVRSLDRLSFSGKPIKGKLLKTDRFKGYMQVQLHHGGNQMKFYVHRLVLEAFVGPCPPRLVCQHLDGDRANNRLENLRWATIQACHRKPKPR